MRLKKEQPSKNVQINQRPNWDAKGDREDRKSVAKSQDRIYNNPAYRRAIEDASAEFQSKYRRDGKGDSRSPKENRDSRQANRANQSPMSDRDLTDVFAGRTNTNRQKAKINRDDRYQR